jgi:hypothetical protein
MASAVLCLYWKLVAQLKSENGHESGSLSKSVQNAGSTQVSGATGPLIWACALDGFKC